MRKNNKNKKVLLICIVLIVNVAALTLISTFQKTKIIYKNKIVYKEKKTIDEHKIKVEENIVFLGDSITDYYPIKSIYGDLPIVNSGVAGYTTEDILDRMDTMVYQYNPTSVYLLIGTNDIMYEDKSNDVVENIKKIVDNIKKNRNQTEINILSLYPVNKTINESLVRKRDNSIIKKINSSIKSYCKKNNIKYINMYDELTDENDNFSNKYTSDGLHPNDMGYAKISTILLPYIYGLK